jgi:hemerythrin
MKVKAMDNPKHKNHVTWSESYSMKVKLIDDQHKGLINFVNDLFEHASGKEKEERLYFSTVIQQAVQYIKEHFQAEERLMLGTKFPGYAEHKKVHDEFTMTVIKSVKEFEAGKRLVLAKFAYFLKDWVLTHIAVMDVKYAEYFKKIAVRKEDGKLHITKAEIS